MICVVFYILNKVAAIRKTKIKWMKFVLYSGVYNVN